MGQHVGFKLEQVLVEMTNSFALDLLTAAARGFPVLETAAAFLVRRFIAVHALADDLAVDQVGGLFRRVAQETLRRRPGGGTCGLRFGSVQGAGWGGCVHGVIFNIDPLLYLTSISFPVILSEPESRFIGMRASRRIPRM